MAVFIGVVSQKGGVGKSTLARLVAREYAAAGWTVKIADLDVSQSTSFAWQGRRLSQALSPEVAVEQFPSVAHALRIAQSYDLVIFDGAPHATAATKEIAQAADLIVLPTGLSLDDLEPTIRLAHELVQYGIPRAKLAIALCRIGDSPRELTEAQDYIRQTGYSLLPGALPEKTAYRRASDLGRTPAETTFPSLNKRAEELAQAIIDRVTTLTKPQEGDPHGNDSGAAPGENNQGRAASA